jgi:hypothetical protein
VRDDPGRGPGELLPGGGEFGHDIRGRPEKVLTHRLALVPQHDGKLSGVVRAGVGFVGRAPRGLGSIETPDDDGHRDEDHGEEHQARDGNPVR